MTTTPTLERHQIPPGIIGGRVDHKPKGKPYAYGAVPSAFGRAARLGRAGIDFDMRSNGQGHGYGCHQANPTKGDGWVDPLGRVNDSTPILRMSDADCERLIYHGEHMMSLREAMLLAKKLGLVLCIEDKTFTGHSVEFWADVKAMADRVGVVPVVMSLPGFRSIPGTRKLKTAHEAGLVTMWLWRRGSKVPDFVDLVKSHRRRPIYRRSDTALGPVVHPASKKRRRRPVPRPWRKRWNPARLRRQGRHQLAALVAAWRKKHPRKRRRR